MRVPRVVWGAIVLTFFTIYLTTYTASAQHTSHQDQTEYDDEVPYVGQLVDYNASDPTEILISFLAAVSRVPTGMGEMLRKLSESSKAGVSGKASPKINPLTLLANNNDTALNQLLRAFKSSDSADATLGGVGTVERLHLCFRTDFDGSMIAGALQVAVEEINADPNLLPNHKLRYKFENTCGDEKQSAKYFMEHWKLGARVFIGPEVNCRTEAQMAAAQNLPIISYKCKDETVSNKQKYPTFSRTVPAETDITKAFIVMMKEFKWSRFSVIYDSSTQANHELMNAIKKAIEDENKLLFDEDFKFSIQNISILESFSEVAEEEPIAQIIQQTKDSTRIYVTFGNVRMFRRIVRIMGQLGLMDNQDYLLIYLDPDYNWLNKYHAMNNHFARNTMVDLKTSWDGEEKLNDRIVVEKYLRNAIAIIPTPIDSDRPRFHNFWRKSNEYLVNFGVQMQDFSSPDFSIRVNRFACYLYDAVYVYARALHKLIESTTEQQSRGYDPTRDGVAITKNIQRQTYDSMGGFAITINDSGDAKGNYTLLAWQDVEPVVNNSTPDYYPLNHALDVTGVFIDNGAGLPKLVFKKKMKWLTGSPPPDQPECGFDGELCRGGTVVVITSIVISFVLIGGGFMVLLAFSYFRTSKYEKELEGQWRLDISKILRIDNASNMNSSNLSLIAAQKEFFDQSFFLSSARVINEWAIYEQKTVLMKELQFRKPKEITRQMKIEMKALRSLNHLNVNPFVGLITDYSNRNFIIIVREFCGRSSLHDVLMNNDTRFGEMFSISFVDDLIRGMTYIHNSQIKVHGNLKSTNCLVTPRWVLKVGDFGLSDLRRCKDREWPSFQSKFEDKMWMAPELLVSHVFDDLPYVPTQKGDVYSFGIILHEIAYRHGPLGTLGPWPAPEPEVEPQDQDQDQDTTTVTATATAAANAAKSLAQTPEALIQAIVEGWRPPCICNEDWPGPEIVCAIEDTMRKCWDDNPDLRPEFKNGNSVRSGLAELFKKHKEKNVMENMLDMMEEYQGTLEFKVFERTKQLHEEQQRSIALLERMLPRTVADQLLAGSTVKPELFPSVTIYFSDIVGFTSLASHSSPMQVVVLLNKLYTLFDKIIKKYVVYKVETIGDAYMVVSGVPQFINGPYHCEQIGLMALNLLASMKNFTIPHRDGERLLLRIGMHTGPCVAGIVGSTMPRYCLFGDTVNVASRMESTGEPLKIHVSECTFDMMMDKADDTTGHFICEKRNGFTFIKGKGDMRTYFVLGHTNHTFEEIPDPVTNFDPIFVNQELFPKKGTYRPQIRESSTALNKDTSTLSLLQRVKGSDRGTPKSDYRDINAYYCSQNGGMVSLNSSYRELGSVCEEDSGNSTGHSGNSTIRHGRRLYMRRPSTRAPECDKPALRKRSTSLPDPELLSTIITSRTAEECCQPYSVAEVPGAITPHTRRSTDSRSLHSPSLPRSAYPSYKDVPDVVKRKGGRPLSVWKTRKRSLSMGDMVTVHMVPENLGRLKKQDSEAPQRRRRRMFSKDRKSLISLKRDPSPFRKIRESSPFRHFGFSSDCDSLCDCDSERSGSRGESLSRLWNKLRNGSQNEYRGLNESDNDREAIEENEQAVTPPLSRRASSHPGREVDDCAAEPLIPELMV